MEVTISQLGPGASLQGVSPGTSVRSSTQSSSLPITLPPGTIIRGFVLNRDAQGNPILRTENGDFLVESKFFFKIGSEVVVRVDATGQNFRASILTVDGQAPQIAEKIPAHNADADVVLDDLPANTASRGRRGFEPAVNTANTGGRTTASTAQTTATTARDAASVQNVVQGTLVRPAIAAAGATATSSLVTPAATSPGAVPTGTSPVPVQVPLPVGVSLELRIVDTRLPATPPAAQPAVGNAPAQAGATSTNVVSTPGSVAAQTAVNAPATGNIPVAAVQVNPERKDTAPAAAGKTSAATTQAQGGAAPTTTTAGKPAAADPPAPATGKGLLSKLSAYARLGGQAPVSQVQQASAVSRQGGEFQTLPGQTSTQTSNPNNTNIQQQLATVTRQLTGQTFSAQVIQGSSPTTPLVQTPYGVVRLEGAPAFAEGTQLTLQVRNLTAPAEGSVATREAAPLPQQILSLGQQWTTLNEIVQTLMQLDQDATLQMLRSTVPSFSHFGEATFSNLFPNVQNLNTGFFVFMAALGGSSFRNWIGERNAAVLEKAGHGEMLIRAGAEFRIMQSLFADVAPGQWQSLFLPVLAEGEIRPIRFFMKRNRKRREDGSQEEGDTRFVVELELSQLGEIQLDGLVRKKDGKTNFNLIIRTHMAFDNEIENTIRDIYTRIGEATGYTGNVGFEQEEIFHLKPLEEIIASAHKGLLI